MLEVESRTGQAAKVNRNIYGTNLLMRTADGQSYYYMYNGHADVTALINPSTGDVVATYYYDAFGNIDPTGTTGSPNNSITYAGYQYDKETGLYYLNARMYDPKIARFLQEDTYTGSVDDPLSLNLYTYCHNEPLMYSDPTGHDEVRYSYHIYLSQLGSANNYVPGYYPTPSISAISASKDQKQETKTKPSNPITKSVESFEEIGTGFWNGALEKRDHSLDSPYDFVNYITLGATGGIWEGLEERGKKQFDSPYYFVNHATWGSLDVVKGAVAPEDPYSPDHWLNSFGFAGMVYGLHKVKTGSNGTNSLSKNKTTSSPVKRKNIADDVDSGTSNLGRFAKREITQDDVIGNLDSSFAKLSQTKKIEEAFKEIENAFGSEYASKIRNQYNKVNNQSLSGSNLKDFGEFNFSSNGTPYISLSKNFGNAKIMANTILHEVKHFRDFQTSGLTVTEFLDPKLLASQEYSATFNNLWQGSKLGLDPNDLNYYYDYFINYEAKLP